MDYFQGVVEDYLRSRRSRFVNSECLIQLDPDKERKGRHWYCDFLTVDFSERTAYLCEVTFARGLQSLTKRLNAWISHWSEVRGAIFRDCGIPEDWAVATWLFVPHEYKAQILSRMKWPGQDDFAVPLMPEPRITSLEEVMPWKYRSWNGTRFESR